jgi:hypothetical protein
MQRQLYDSHGGGGGGNGSKLPAFAQDIAEILFRTPFRAFTSQGRDLGPNGGGIFGDIQSGYNAGNADDLFSGLMGMKDQAQQGGDYFRNNAMNLTDRGINAQSHLNDLAMGGAEHSSGYNNMNDRFLEQSGRGFNNLMSLVGAGGGGPGSQLSRTPGIGEAGRRALAASENVGPDSKLYKSTLSFMTPAVRAASSARGMGNSGSAVAAEGDQARQLADSFAMRAQQEKNNFLQTAVGSEGANASFQGALNSALANMYGSQVQGATAATEAPTRIFQGMQSGLGQGIQNIGNATGQYLQPLQMNSAGLSNYGSAMGMPLSTQQSLYNFFRSPQSQLLGVPSSTGQQSLGGHPNGLLGDILGFEKGG